MTNRILEALGVDPTEIAAHDPAKTLVSISIERLDGHRLLIEGTLANPVRMTAEGYYRVGDAGAHGPCISAMYAKSPTDALRVLASSIIGARPKPGQVAAFAAELPTRATVRFHTR